MFRKLLCFSAAFILILTSFCIPSFADSFPVSNNYGTSNSFSAFTSYSPKLYKINGSDVGISSSPAADVYAFYYDNDNVCFASPSSNVTVYFIFYNSSSNNRQLNLNYSNGFLYYNYATVSASDFYIPHYDSIQSGLSALKDFIENPPSYDPIYDDLPDFNIQRGYAAYIDFGSDWSSRSISGTLTSSFPQYSSLISGDWDGTDNRRYFWTDSLPSNTNFSSNVGSAIDWTKVPPYDLLQRSKNGIWFIQSNSPLNRYLVIVNPNQWRYGQNPTDDTINSPIIISDLSGSTGDVKFFALNQKFDTDGTLVSAASDNASNNRTGTYDPDTGQWEMTDSSGNAADQVPGGESDTPVISSISDYIHNITSVLTNFANSVISLIQAPISHISDLIDAGSGFMASLRGMYSWLPVDIQGLVISALTVVIGIGVFKVFL